MSTPGFFDKDLRKEAWFNGTTIPEGWFDERLIPVSGAAPSVPAAPLNLSASSGDNTVNLTWSASAGATSYKLYRSTTSGFYVVPLASGIVGTTYLDTTALNGTHYYYIVRATNAVGDSADSNEADATPQAAVISGAGGRPMVHGPRQKIVYFQEDLELAIKSQVDFNLIRETPFELDIAQVLSTDLIGNVYASREFSSRLEQAILSDISIGFRAEKSFVLQVEPSAPISIISKVRYVNIERDRKLAESLLALEEEVLL
jgi:hypothetical protein